MNTVENNRLIAEFMGWKEQTNPTKRWFGHWFDPNGRRQSELFFDFSWDDLMPVVEKIENLRLLTDKVATFSVVIYPYHVRIQQHPQHALAFEDEFVFRLIEKDGKSKIYAVYQAVIKFIKWYNDNISK